MDSIRKSELPPVPWRTLDVGMGVALSIVSLVVLSVLYAITYLALDKDTGFTSALAIVGGGAYAMMLAISWFVGPARHGTQIGSLGLRLPSSKGYYQLALPVLALAASLTFTGLYVGLMSLLGWDVPESLPEDFDIKGPTMIGGFFALVVLLGPLSEEVFFRGFMFPGLMGWMGVRGAAIASSLLFALAHGQLNLIVPIFVTGMLLAWLYYRTGSVWSCFAAHAMQNALAFSIFLSS